MDVLTALGLAGNIVQFIDFSIKLVVHVAEITRSASGASQRTLDIETAYQKLETFTASLQHPRPIHSSGVPLSHYPGLESYQSQVRAHVDALRELGTECNNICKKLLQVVGRLHVKTGSGGKAGHLARSFATAVKAEFAGKEISDLQQQLLQYQTAISLRYCPLLELQQTAMLSILTRLHQDGISLGNSHTARLDSLIATINEIVDHQKQNMSPSVPRSAPMLSPQDVHSLERAMEKLALAEKDMETLAREQILIASLHFESLEYRHESIPKAHRSTFEWLFPPDIRKDIDSDSDDGDSDDDSDDENNDTDDDDDDKETISEVRARLFNWLQHGSSTFWVSGKAGSGKSTLMRFTADDPRTRDALRTWAGPDKPVVLAAHYFWKAGTTMQKSLKGLLQTLLYDILRQCPGLAATIFPEQWRSTGPTAAMTNRHWSVDELHNGLRAIACTAPNQLPAKFCCFIDGLDEFSGDKFDHSDLCQLLGELSTSSNLKFCVSSRPWSVFEDAFSGDQLTQLCIHELTKRDICTFVRGRLTRHPRWSNTFKDSQEAKNLIRDVVERADGVFLWAHLVTQALRRGFVDGDTVKDLKRRLDALPTDIEPMYSHMLSSVDPFHHQYMARTLLLALEVTSVSILHTREFEDDDPDYALNKPVVPSLLWDMSRRADCCRRINARCGGLLSADGIMVSFIHRTARDFLRTKAQHSDLVSKAGSSFCVSMAIAKVFVFEALRGSEVPDYKYSLYIFEEAANCRLHSTQHAEQAFRLLRSLGVLPNTLPNIADTTIPTVNHFTVDIDRRIPQAQPTGNLDQELRLAFLDAGLPRFVRQGLEIDSQYFDNTWTGETAIARLFRLRRWSHTHLSILRALIKSCPDVNARISTHDTTSPSHWHAFFICILRMCKVCIKTFDTEDLTNDIPRTVQEFLDAGANAHRRIRFKDGSTAYPSSIYMHVMLIKDRRPLSPVEYELLQFKRMLETSVSTALAQDMMKEIIGFMSNKSFPATGGRYRAFRGYMEVIVYCGVRYGLDMQGLILLIKEHLYHKDAAPLVEKINKAQSKMRISFLIHDPGTKRPQDEMDATGSCETKRAKVGESSTSQTRVVEDMSRGGDSGVADVLDGRSYCGLIWRLGVYNLELGV